MPTHRVRMRRDVNRLLDVIRVLAWLHQHARERDELGRILATEEDFRAALALVGDSLGRAWDSMTPVEEAVMDAVRSLPEAVRKNGFKRGELPLGDMDARRVQDVLKSLTESGHIECEKKGGPGGYRYTVPRDPTESVLGISLSPPDEDSDADDDDLEVPDAEEDPEPGHGMDPEGEARVPRESARAGDRALDGPLSPAEAPIALPRGEEDGFVFGDDEAEDDEPDAEAVDHLGELTERGWYRAQTLFTPGGDTETDLSDGDPVARRLRHEVGIYQGRGWWSDDIGNPTPLAFTADDLFEAGPAGGDGGSEGAPSWPATPQEMPGRLRRAVSYLQAGKQRFWDVGLSAWYAGMRIDHPTDTEKVRKEAYLHAELWANESTGQKIWALVALKEGRRVPDEAIEEAVWLRVTSGRSPWAEPELLPEP